MRGSFLLCVALTACGGPSASAPSKTAPASTPSSFENPPAPPPDPYTEECTPDTKRPVHLVLDLDHDVNWKRDAKDVTRDLVTRLQAAAKVCDGATVSPGSDESSLNVELPKPCGPDSATGKLVLRLLPPDSADFAQADFDGSIADAHVVGRAFVSPAKSKNKACLAATLDRVEQAKSNKSLSERLGASKRVQNAVVELFFPVLY